MSKTDELIEQLINQLQNQKHMKAEDIPNIDLYMDQVTTFMNSHLDNYKRFPDDKILTKTMINNYAKNDLLPPPEKKKYSKNHLIILTFIYYFKGFLSIGDIQKMLRPLTDRHFNEPNNISLEDIYTTVFSLEESQLKKLTEELTHLNELSKTVFTDMENSEILQSFALICLLSYDVYMKKKVIETMIDQLIPESADAKAERKEKKRTGDI